MPEFKVNICLLTEIDNYLLLFCADTKELNMKQTFEELLNRYSIMVERNIEKRYNKAKDKEFVRNEIEREFAFLNVIQVAGEHKEKMVDTFVTYYKRGESVEEVLLFIRKVYGEAVKDVLDFKRVENGVSLPIYISDEEKELREFVMNPKKLKCFFIRFLAFKEIEKNLRVLFIKSVEPFYNGYSLVEDFSSKKCIISEVGDVGFVIA